MKYPDIIIQIKYPNKLINADTPLMSINIPIDSKNVLRDKIENV